jgi:preprotein translocase subunit SecA
MEIVNNLAKKIFGTQNQRELKTIHPIVAQINSLEAKTKSLTNDQLIAKTAEFKSRISRGESLDSILPESFAVMREASWRVIGQRHYDVQLIGGITLHRGRIAEMKTGEGKTLVSTLPAYLNALSGKGVHVITVNDYLARRDSEWMGRIHRFLGLNVGIIVHGLTDRQRQTNYNCDITYGTNSEFGFDYLRDNMKFRLEDYVQRELNFGIVDEVDSILIDEARTPLIISGPSEDSTDLYYEINNKLLNEGGLTPEVDYTVDEKAKSASLTEAGVDKMEKRLKIANLYDPQHIEILHHVNQALRARVIFKLDVDYVVQNGEVMIVDEFTGRIMPGRRWSDGLHQAIEAKENVTIENENQTLATITYQNFFRMYNKLSGMTGTADTEAAEFKQIYKLDVTIIPTNKNMVRKDMNDKIYKNQAQKYKAIVEHIKQLHQAGQPVLVGTISVSKSELISDLLKKDGVKHNVLNAKQNEREADIVAQAGQQGAVTIATNMAGRGTDILLGGNPEFKAKSEIGPLKKDATDDEKADYQKVYESAISRWKTQCEIDRETVKSLGGLFILGTERHESRRIDNQLRGRAGRQGDPGASQFYLALDDDLLRIFGGANIARWMDDDVAIEDSRLISRSIENAQRKVEGHNYDIRKHLLEYDDVMNQQRKVIYRWRREVLAQDQLKEMMFSMATELAQTLAKDFFPNGKLPRVKGQAFLDLKELNSAITNAFQIQTSIQEKNIDPFNDRGLEKLIINLGEKTYNEKEKLFGEPFMRQIDPLLEYKKEGYRFFQMMMHQITGDSIQKIFAVQPAFESESEARRLSEEEAASMTPKLDERPPSQMQYNLSADGSLIPNTTPAAAALPVQSGGIDRRPQNPTGPQMPVQNSGDKVGRNDPCPCGSGKKFKKCHGQA